ncbi:MAG: zinc-ribbon domain-containing protein [Acetobacteraceae bacterium]|nr:zinc-ribbon domain-containing protein [Acetobacteraceae bacterium]
MRLVSHGKGGGLNLSLAQKPAVTENRAMLIECPKCTAGFQVPERMMRDRTRPLRCSQCRTVFPMPNPPVPEPFAFRPPEPLPPSPVAEEPRPAPRPFLEEPLPEQVAALETPAEVAQGASSRRLRAAWAASIALLLGGGLAAIIKRDAVVEAWPPAARLFSALGLL